MADDIVRDDADDRLSSLNSQMEEDSAHTAFGKLPPSGCSPFLAAHTNHCTCTHRICFPHQPMCWVHLVYCISFGNPYWCLHAQIEYMHMYMCAYWFIVFIATFRPDFLEVEQKILGFLKCHVDKQTQNIAERSWEVQISRTKVRQVFANVFNVVVYLFYCVL